MNLADNRPHVVHILGSLNAGGAPRLVYNLIAREDRDFQHSVVWILSGSGRFHALFKRMGIPLYSCPVYWPRFDWLPSYRLGKWMRLHSMWTFPLRLAFLLKRVRAEVVHTHISFNITLQLKAFIQYLNLPIIWSLHEMFRYNGTTTSDLDNAVRRILDWEKGAIIGVSRAVLEDVIGSLNVARHRAGVIYNGIPLEEFSQEGKKKEGLRHEWGIPEGALVYGSAGRLVPVKRFDLLIQAFHQVASVYPNAHLVIAGEGTLHTQLQQMVQDLGLTDNAHLIGFQSDMAAFWANVDVAVTSSDSEGLPMALLEACATGLPCIATRVGGIPEVLRDGAGILVEPGNTDALANAMIALTDPNKRSEFSQRARAVAKYFSIENTIRQYSALYHELLRLR